MYCRFSFRSWSCIGIQCTGERTPVHGAVHRMSKCTGEMTPAHWTVASLHENTLHSTTGRGACSTGQDFTILQPCIQNRMTRECRSPCTCFPHDMHNKNVPKLHCMHVQCFVPRPAPITACSPDNVHMHWHPWGFPCLSPSLPHMFPPLQTPNYRVCRTSAAVQPLTPFAAGFTRASRPIAAFQAPWRCPGR